MTPGVRQARKRLTTMPLSQEQARTLDRQIGDVVLMYLDRFNAYQSPRELMEALARDAYFQGLIDGAQLPTRMTP